MSELVTRSEFYDCLNSAFRVISPVAERMELVLIQVSELARSHGQETFSILFQGPLAPRLLQGICSLEHDRLGQQDIFIVPVSENQQGICYEAVFNRLLP